MNVTTSAVLALALLAPAGAAQLTGKQADAQMRALAKQARKEHAAAVNERVVALDAAIDAFLAAALSGGGGVGGPFDDLFDALVDFQTSLYYEFLGTWSTVCDDAIVLLDQFADGADLAGVYPAEFHFGTSDALDDLRGGMLATQSKALAKARKLLAKAASKLAKAGSARIAFFLEAATLDGQHFFKQGTYGGQTRDPLVLHTVLTLGFEGSADSGTILAAGLGDVDGDPLSVRAVGEGPLETVAVTFTAPGTPAWTVRIDNDLAGMADGNYYVVAWQGAYASSQGAQVSIR